MDFKKEIKIAKYKLDRNSSLQNYFNWNHLLFLKNIRKRRKSLKPLVRKTIKRSKTIL